MAKKQRNRNNEKTKAHAANKPAEPPQDPAEDLTPEQARAAKFRIAAMRENVEAIVVAFILALLFRAFLAEAFVIPTGSMAPTLMGAHKDVFCDQCGQNFRVGASRERVSRDQEATVVAGTCPNCRCRNHFDLANDPDEGTFNGDRILVNKFSYVLSDPERWDVIVFKFPGNPKQNYIKRLVGLPNETVSIFGGDVYAAATGSGQSPKMLRKPAETQLAMQHLVYDSDHQASALLQAGYPSRWQPWEPGATSPPQNSWQVEQNKAGLIAKVTATDVPKWLRYFHHFPTPAQWELANSGKSLANVDPYRSRAITDFHAYGSYVYVPSGYVYDEFPTKAAARGIKRMIPRFGYTKGVFKANYRSGDSIDQFGSATSYGRPDSILRRQGPDGMHWVGDLMLTADLQLDPSCQQCTLEIVEAGIQYQCRIDLSSGVATLSILDGERPRAFDSVAAATQPNQNPTAATPVRAGGRHQMRISNSDDQMTLWIDGEVVEFDAPTTFDARVFRPADVNRPYRSKEHPLDAAPLGIAITGGTATIERLQVHRDKYYIAAKHSSQLFDYDFGKFLELTDQSVSPETFQQVLANPEQWATFQGWKTRRQTTYEMKKDQFFPMGDNSPESLDARCWAGTKPRLRMPRGVNQDAWVYGDASYVPRDLMVGRAVIVFWPHSWRSPVPLTPNLKRMKLIR